MRNIIIYITLALIIALAVYGTVKRIRHGSACCGEHEPPPKKIRVRDKNRNNYPYVYELTVDGMHCANCARRIENSFNSRDGMWAIADIGRKTVDLRSKKEIGEAACRDIVSKAGYTLIKMREERT